MKRKVVDVLLIHPPFHRRRGSSLVPPMGLAYLASSLRGRGYTVHIIDASLLCDSLKNKRFRMLDESLLKLLKTVKVNLCIGIGPCTTPALLGVKKVIDIVIATYRKPIVLGGPHISLSTFSLDNFRFLNHDISVIGEGEITIADICDAIRIGNKLAEVEGIIYRDKKDGNLKRTPSRPLIEDLDCLPFPARDLLSLERYILSVRRKKDNKLFTPIFASRGCPYECTYCCGGILFGKRYRLRSIENIIREVKECKDVYGIKNFIFYDDNFLLTAQGAQSRIRDFCKMLHANHLRVRWQVELRPDTISMLNENYLLEMVNAGCEQINVGFEKGFDAGLRRIRKYYSLEQCKNVILAMKSANHPISITGTFLLGGKDETQNDIRKTVEFAKETRIDYAHFYPMEIYPGTSLWDEAREYGVIDPGTYLSDIMDMKDEPFGRIVYTTPTLPKKKLIQLRQWAYRQFYFSYDIIVDKLRCIGSLKDVKRLCREYIIWLLRGYTKF